MQFTTTNQEFYLNLKKALGLDGVPLRRLVLVADAGCVLKVYTEGPADISEWDGEDLGDPEDMEMHADTPVEVKIGADGVEVNPIEGCAREFASSPKTVASTGLREGTIPLPVVKKRSMSFKGGAVRFDVLVNDHVVAAFDYSQIDCAYGLCERLCEALGIEEKEPAS